MGNLRFQVCPKITDFYKCIGTAKEITTEIWDGDGDISQVDLERFTAAEKIKEESDTSMTPSVATSNASSTQVIFLCILLALFLDQLFCE